MKSRELDKRTKWCCIISIAAILTSIGLAYTRYAAFAVWLAGVTITFIVAVLINSGYFAGQSRHKE